MASVQSRWDCWSASTSPSASRRTGREPPSGKGSSDSSTRWPARLDPSGRRVALAFRSARILVTASRVPCGWQSTTSRPASSRTSPASATTSPRKSACRSLDCSTPGSKASATPSRQAMCTVRSEAGIASAAWTGWLSDAPLKPLADILGADPNPFPLLIVAYAVRRMPYVARSAAAGLQQTSVSMEEAAWNVGASRWTTLRRIVLPLIAANLVAGALLSFSFSMLEVSDSLLLAQRERDYPITKAIYVLYDRLGDGEQVAAAMGVWAMALLAVTLLAANAVIGRRMGALFRA
ncbi:MAG: ABC transporter permease subunit [Planctomycetes bacterium]|nr:ABC transporter permease subunit [Planctomycetota bacterium]